MIYSSDQFSYDPKTRTMTAEASTLGLPPGHWPDSVQVRSMTTGRVLMFVQDREAAIKNEFWDGEMVQYIPGPLNGPINVKYLVILND